MTRPIWKGPFIDPYILSSKFSNLQKKIVWSRNSTIPASLIGSSVFIYNGLDYTKVHITREKIGFKFGEFAVTRKFTKKTKTTQKKKK